MGSVSISKGNTKMGGICSVSLPAVITCRICDCHSKCYARRLEKIRPSVKRAYQRNLDVLINDTATYWREVEASIMMSRFFRFHVSGDIVDMEYFRNMIEISSRNNHCHVLCFTKKYDIVNRYIESYEGNIIPCNLHIVFSHWDNLPMDNPHNFPVAYVKYRDGHTSAPADAIECRGNCSECAITDGGCWSLMKGESVVFEEH